MRARPSRYRRFGKSTAKTSCRKAFTGNHRKLGLEPLEHRLLLSGVTFTVTNTDDSGLGSFRQAIIDANDTSGADLIAFNIDGGAPHTIQPLSALPAISDPVTIDGTTQPGFLGTPIIELDGSAPIPPEARPHHGLWIAADGCTVRGLVINWFDVTGIVLYGSDDNVIEGNYIGTDVSGTSDAGNLRGVVIASSSGNRIGTNGDGTNDDAERNVISGNDEAGIVIEGYWGGGDNIVAGNYIGTDFTGTAALPNHNGVTLKGGASGNVIGIDGTDAVFNASERNVISGNTRAGVDASWTEDSTGNVIAGNYIGTDKTGNLALPNERGIWFEMGPNSNLIGTDADGVADELERNVISGNTLDGVYLWGSNVHSNVVAGNYIGTNADGDASLPNRRNGIWVRAASRNRIGTDGKGSFNDNEAERNVISGNGLSGVYITDGASYNQVAGNYIGTSAGGLEPLGNGYDPWGLSNSWYDEGVWLTSGSHHNWIGTNSDNHGDDVEGNVISASHGNGVRMRDSGTNYNVVAGNYIGTDRTGLAGLGNGESGVALGEGPKHNRIGTDGDGISDEAERNVISANTGDGVVISQEGTDSNQVSGNFIGTDMTGSGDLGNDGNGAGAWWGAEDNAIGGSPVLANTIAFNGQIGVMVHWTSANNSIRANSIHSNGALGIDLGHNDGVTFNDDLDADDGPNHLQNFPVITSVLSGAVTVVGGTLNSTPITAFTLDFYANTAADPTGYGEGERWLGSAMVTTDASGDASFDVTLSAATVAGESITATATDADGNTSEFSKVLLITNTPPVADDQAVSTDEDVPLDIVLTASDDDGDSLTYSILDGPDHGTLSGTAPNMTYTPDANYYGTDSFTFKANDSQADSNVATVSITVNPVNDAPVISSLMSSHPLPENASGDGSVSISGMFGDVDLSDTHTASVNWGDGSADEGLSIDQLADTLGGSHQYADGGIYEIVVTLDDGHGGADTAAAQAVVEGVGLVDDTLYIIGTDGRDHVKLKFDDKKQEIKVDAKFQQGGSDGGDDDRGKGHDDFKGTFAMTSVDRVVSYLRDGDDHYDGGSDGGSDGDADNAISQFVFGGRGDDHLHGGRGNDVLVGGAGKDELNGGAGNDILLGGAGKDKLDGGNGDDLLVGGVADREGALTALDAALAHWTAGDIDGALLDLGSITDDGAKDDLKGGKGNDTLIGGAGDKLKD